MTWSERLTALLKFGRALAILAAFVLLLLLVRACNGQDAAEAKLARVQEAHEIEKAGLELVAEADKASLRSQLDEARAQSVEFAAALQEAQEKLRNSRPVFVARASTGPVTVRPPVPDGKGGDGGEEVGTRSVGVSPPSCLLQPGDQGEIQVTEAVLETEAGNRVLVGAAEAYRLDPKTLLFGGRFSVPITEAMAEPASLRSSPGWGVGLFGGLASTGPAASIALLTPPLVGDSLSGGLIATGGQDLFAAQLGVTWRP